MQDSINNLSYGTKVSFEPCHEKTCLRHIRTTKMQISLRIIPLVSISEISSLYTVSVAEQAGFGLTWSQTPEDSFSHDMAYFIHDFYTNT